MLFTLSTGRETKRSHNNSSGNHAAALALAAALNEVKAMIVMPETAPKVKKNAVKGYGADITYCKPTLEAREDTVKVIMEDTGATLIHPYDNFNVICGQGTTVLDFSRRS
jgi:threonine dehydratase